MVPKLAEARRSEFYRVRSAVRAQLAHTHRQRQELSRALVLLRRHLQEYRNRVRQAIGRGKQRVAPKTPPALPRVAPPPVQPATTARES